MSVVADLTDAIKLDHDNQYLYYNRGCAYLYNKDYTLAIDDFTRAIAIDQRLAEAFYNRGLARISVGNRQEGIADLSKATIALVTSGGIVPEGNPDHIAASSAQNFGAYSIEGVNDLEKGKYLTAHGGYDQTYANQDPDRVLPIDVLRDLEKEGKIGKLYNVFYTTVGNGTSVANSRKFGTEIGSQLKAAHVDGVILTST